MAREDDIISEAIIATEKEIAGAAWGEEDPEAADDSGDRSLEDMGEGLEGQHELGDPEEAEGDEPEGEEESESETAETEAALAAAAAAKGKDGKPEETPDGRTQPGGRVPSHEYRKVAERARTAEAERDALKAQIEKSKGDTTSLTERLDLVMREITALKTAPREPAKPVEPAKPDVAPDIFEDPKGFADHLTKGFQGELSKRDAQLAEMRLETSMAIAHAVHKDTFEKAFDAVKKLDPQNPEDRMTVQRIKSSPNPGEALISWHKRNETFARVGDDPTKFEADIRKAERETLMKDPEFRKQILADLRAEANQGDDGRPRTTTRLPNSLARAQGSNLGAERGDPHQHDGSDQAVADAAWR